MANLNLEREFLLKREIVHLADECRGTFGQDTVERLVSEFPSRYSRDQIERSVTDCATR